MSFHPINSSKIDASGDRTAVVEIPHSSLSKRRSFRWLVWVVIFVVGLILTGTIYESVSEAADIQAYPPRGQMVNVGDYRLHIDCTGAGSPTVVIDAGWGAWSLEWSGVQAEVAKTT